MKKMIMVILVVVLSLVGLAHSEEYAMVAMVDQVDLATDCFSAIDFGGYNVWEFDEVEDWMVGDLVAMVMEDNGTAEVSDDDVISYRYVGYVDPTTWLR